MFAPAVHLRKALLALCLLALVVGLLPLVNTAAAQDAKPLALLTDPFLQLPTADGVYVVWFTEWAGKSHTVTFGAALDQTVEATTTKLSRMAEDQNSRVGEQIEDGQVYKAYTPRDIWRHEAQVTGLSARVPYFVTSIADDDTEVKSGEYTLAPLPTPGQPLKILLTSDHQLKENTPANLQMVEKVTGGVDAVFFAGDLVNIPDRASEWFDDNRGWAFFPGLQGKGGYTLKRKREQDGVTFETTRTYVGGQLIQHAPLFPALGNHEVMGRYTSGTTTGYQYNDPQPRAVAEARYEQLAALVNPTGDADIRARWIEDNSFNSLSYEELFTLPNDGPAGEQFWGMAFGDVYVISLYSTRIWRTPGLDNNARGKYREQQGALNQPDNWGYGDFIFEDLAMGSRQYNWLVEQLESEAFKSAKYKVVIMHQGPHGLGDNYNPVFAHPVQIIDRDANGMISAVRYEYPIDQDVLIRDIQPLFEQAGVQLVHQGHSHIWFRLQKDGVTYMETSNVGNNYGCYVEGYKERANVPNDPRYDAKNYAKVGDPHGLEPIMPSIFAPQQDNNGADLPCVNSNDLTVFTVFETESGAVRSYVFDTRDPLSEPRLFDEFTIGQ